MRIVYLQGINMKAIPKVLVFIILAGTIAQGVFSLRVGFHSFIRHLLVSVHYQMIAGGFQTNGWYKC